MNIEVPAKLRLKDCLQFSAELRKAKLDGLVTIDFGRLNYGGPFGLLMLCATMRMLRRENPNLQFQPRNYAQHSYFGHLGLFRAMGFDYGREPGAAFGNENYLPITIREVVSVREEARTSGRPIGELVEEEARSLAEILGRTKEGPIFETLSFALREIIRNTVEHSRSPAVEWCAQYWPNNDRVEIAVFDAGVGIFRTLGTNPSLNISDEKHAINLALMPGISRNVILGRAQVITNVWQNSGFGLFMTQRMCRKGGDFFLASGDHGKFLKNDESKWFNYGFAGTAVRMVLRPSAIGSLRAALTQFEVDAKVIAAKNNMSIPDASTASRMIRLELY